MSTGFNLLSLKKEDTQNFKNLYRKHVLVGEDIFTVALLLELVEKYGKEQVLWICPREVQIADLLPLGPSQLRGRENIQKFKQLFPEIDLEIYERPAEFFKDLKWKEFGGRSRPEKLLYNENFFTECRGDFNIEELFPFLKEEGLTAKLQELRHNIGLKSVEKTLSDDLAEPHHFELVLTDNTRVKCETLYWGESAESFLNIYKDKNKLETDFITFCESTHTPSALYVRLVFERPITEKEATLFIPLSYTHEWGHFVGEFHSHENNQQVANFVTFLEADSTNEDEISKKIRLLKKNCEKIFGVTIKEIEEEYIKLSTTSSCLKIDDSLAKSFETQWGYLKLISVNAPLEFFSAKDSSFEDSKSIPSTFIRGVLRNQEIIHSLT